MATTTAGQETKQQLMESGVDEGTADKAADVKMGETALGWGLNTIPGGRYISGMIPNAITRLGVKMGIGAGIVTGTDYIGGETRGAILEDAGYQKQADPVRQWDAWRIGADMLGGAMLAIGGSERPRTTEVLPDDVRASAQHIIETDHLIHDSAPGIPATPQASAFTSEATRTGIQQIENGQPVNIADVPGLESAEFLSPHAPAGHASSGPAVPAGSREAAAARKNIATYETALDELRADRDSTIKFIETARRDGYHEEADHFAENVLPGKNNIVSQYESRLDYARDDVHALENPQALSRAAEEIRPQLEEHAQAKADMNAYADTFESPLQE
ncbi:hypothetical protein, partial [Leclercia adecarboxylata]|uniref:hypothetical protein n=1 Tax=Leclercia adecarboxylata TaxID=83655 RepID=UPI003D2B8738